MDFFNNIMNLPVTSFTLSQEPMPGRTISLMQMFPFPGELGIQSELAQFDAEIVRQQLQEPKNDLIRRAKSSYFELFLADKEIEILNRNLLLWQQWVRAADDPQ